MTSKYFNVDEEIKVMKGYTNEVFDLFPSQREANP